MVSAFQFLVPKWEAEKGLVLMQIQDVAENMSLEEGKAFYYRLINLAKGKVLPNREDLYEWITYDTFVAMRVVDEHLT